MKKIVKELIDYFVSENKKYQNIVIPNSYEEQRNLLRGLINLRKPLPIPDEILKKEDKLLQLELKEKGITDIKNLKQIDKNIYLWLGDITTLKVDLIVNAGNNDGLGCFNPTHHCIDNTIHTFSGIRLRLECNDILKGKKLSNGNIIVCNGYNLPCKKIITTVGPQIFNDIKAQDKLDLENCYRNSLEYAIKNGYKSIAFPSIATGLFGYPIDLAKNIAYKVVKEYTSNNDILVIFNVFSKEDYNEYSKLFKS
jgi:O-acetyl-ADP-ribose deacetylase (regulator of RNase III)